MSSISSILFLAAAVAVNGQPPAPTTQYAFNKTGPLSTFKSRPDISAPFLNMTVNNEALVTLGYIFLEPYQTTQPGPYLYDNAGNLVWSGFQSTGPGPAHDFHVCPYNGSDHLCFFTGQQYVGYARGVGLILDTTLKVVQSVQSQGSQLPIDQHEFNVINNGKSALIEIYSPQQADLSADGIASGLGWIMNCWFQEIALDTNKILFEWSALDHVSPSHSFIAPNSTESSGTGLDPTQPWDYFHINSVDKDSAGDYLISARHTSTVYKISGKNGTILWQLGGKSNLTTSSFALTGGLNFSYQHDARFVYANATTTVLSLFDNAADGFHTQSANYSSGLLIAIDHPAATARLLQSYPSPPHQFSASQGSLQLLHPTAWATSNVYCSWGESAYISEYTHDSTLIQSGHFATTGAMHYRSRKANITLHPTDAPSLYAYALDSSSSTHFYVSWNGATEVRAWRIYTATGSSTQDPTFTKLVSFAKEGFETLYTAPGFQRWSIVEALYADGSGARNSSRVTETFVPGTELAAQCDEAGCPSATAYSGAGPSVASVMHPEATTPTTTATSRAAVAGRTLVKKGVKGAAVVGLAGLLI